MVSTNLLFKKKLNTTLTKLITVKTKNRLLSDCLKYNPMFYQTVIDNNFKFLTSDNVNLYSKLYADILLSECTISDSGIVFSENLWVTDLKQQRRDYRSVFEKRLPEPNLVQDRVYKNQKIAPIPGKSSDMNYDQTRESVDVEKTGLTNNSEKSLKSKERFDIDFSL